MRTEEIRWTHRDKNFEEVFSLNVSFNSEFLTKEEYIYKMEIMWVLMQDAIKKFTSEKVS